MSTQAAPKPIRTPDATLEQRIDETRHLVRQVDVSLAVLSLATLLFGGVILAMLADHWLVKGGLSGTARLGVFAGLLGAIGLFAYRRIVPLFLYPINPVYAAQVLERSSPSIKNSVINWILLRRERFERGGALPDKLAERMMDGVARTAAAGVDSIPAEQAVETRGIARWGVALTLLMLFLVGYTLLSPKNPLTSIARILLPFSAIDTPQAVQFRDVRPGDTTTLQGERITISAEVVGRSREPVYLFFSTDDGQAVRQAVPMTLPEGKTRYEVSFPPGKSGFVSGVEYWIGQGESESGRFRIDVREIASLEVASVTYRYPEYTGLPEETIESGGDIRAVEGTEVRILLRSSLPMEWAEILFGNDSTDKLAMKISVDRSTEASVAFDLNPDLESGSGVTRRTYTFRAVDAEGYESRRSGVFRLEILPDRSPRVQWSDTATELKDMAQMELPLNASIELPIQAEDPDFSLRNLRFHVESGNKRIRPVELIESPSTGPTEFKGQIERKTVFSPATSRLGVGDTAEIWAEAVDSKLPEPNRATTRRITINVVDPQRREDPPKEPEKRPEEQPEEKEKPQQPENSEQQGNESKSGENKQNRQEQGEEGQEEQQEQNREMSGEENRNQGDESGSSRENGESDQGKDGQQKQDGQSSSNESQGDQPGQDRQQGQQGKEENPSEKPVDPETNPGDAMQRILDQMKKDKKLPEDQNQPDPQDQNEQQQKKSGKDGQKSESQDQQGKEDQQGKPEQRQQEQQQSGQESQQQSQEQKEPQNQKPDCPDGNCGECGKCNGGQGDKQDNKQGEQQKKESEDQQGDGGAQGGPSGSGQKGNDQAEGQQAGKGSEQSGNQSRQGAEQGDQQKSETEKQPGANSRDGGEKSEDQSQADNQGSGGGKTPSPGKEKGGETSGGDQAGDASSEAERREGDNRKSDKQDIPVDPNDDRPRQRDNLDPNTKDRRSQGGDRSEPKKSDETVKDMPHETVSSGDEGQGRETRQTGKSDRAQSASDGKRGDTGRDGVEQKAGADAEGSKLTDRRDDQNEGEMRDDPEGRQMKESDRGEPGRERQDGEPQQQEGQPQQQSPTGEPGREKTERTPNAPGRESGQQEGDGSQDSQVSGGSQGTSTAESNTVREEANLKYTEQVTNLVLEYLEEQLREGPNQDLLKNLGWDEDQLRAFHRKWKAMSDQAQQSEPGSVENDAWKEFLKSIGITPSRDRPQLHRSRLNRKDESRSVESRRYAPPPALKKRFEQYTEGIGR